MPVFRSGAVVLWWVLAALLAAAPAGLAAAPEKLVVVNAGSLAGTTAAVAAFTEATGIPVEVNAFSWSEWDEKLPIMLATGQQVDLIRFDTSHAARYALEGWLVPLTPLIERDPAFDLSLFPEAALWHPPYDRLGELYTIPYNIAAHVMFYDRELLLEAGIPEFPTEHGHPDLQWDAWVATLKKLTKRGPDGTVEQWGTAALGGDGYYLIGLWDVDWVTDDLTRFRGADPDVVEAFTRMTDLWLTDGVAPPVQQRSGYSLLNRNIATDVRQTGTWMTTLDPSQNDLGVAPIPWGRKVAVQGGINSWGISKTTQHLEAAWEFLKFFTAGDGIIHWMAHESRSPVLNRAYGPYWIEQTQANLPHADLAVILDAGSHWWSTKLYLSPAQEKINALFLPAVAAVGRGEKPAAVAMREIADAINRLLEAEPATFAVKQR